MVATKILGLYSTIWEPVLRDEVSRHDLVDFSKKLLQLRKAFTCSVCDQLLTNREVISPTNCMEHFACKACRGKDREPGRKCPKCEDWSTFEENETLDTLLQSYQNFCRYILTCERIVRLLEEMHEGGREPGFDAHRLIDLLAEGLKGAPVEGGKKRRLPNADVNVVDRGVIPIPVPRKRSKAAQVPVVAKANGASTEGKPKATALVTVPPGPNSAHVSSPTVKSAALSSARQRGYLSGTVNLLEFFAYREANSLVSYCIRMREETALSNGGRIGSGAPPLSLIQARMQPGTNPPTSTDAKLLRRGIFECYYECGQFFRSEEELQRHHDANCPAKKKTFPELEQMAQGRGSINNDNDGSRCVDGSPPENNTFGHDEDGPSNEHERVAEILRGLPEMNRLELMDRPNTY